MEGSHIPTERDFSEARVNPGQAGRRSRVGGWAIAAVLAVLALLLYEIRIALLPFVFAIAVAFVTDPWIRQVQRRLGSPRWPVAVGFFVVILAALAGAGYWIVVAAVPDLARVLVAAPQIARHFLTELIGPGVTLFGETVTPERAVAILGTTLRSAIGWNAIAGTAGLAGSLLFTAVLTVVLMPYFMISAPRLAAGAIWLVPPERRAAVESLLPKIVPVLRRYLIGFGIVVAYTAFVGWVGFGPIFHLPHAVLLAVSVGVLELVPVIGPFASATMVGLIALQQNAIWSAAPLLGFVILLRLSIDNLVGPLVLGEAARVPPVVIIISFVCGAILFGVVGLLLAVPAVVCVKVTLEHYYAEPVAAETTGSRTGGAE